MVFVVTVEHRGMKLWEIMHRWFIARLPLGGFVSSLLCLRYSVGPQRLFGRSLTSLTYKENNRISEINAAFFPPKPCVSLLSFYWSSQSSFLFISIFFSSKCTPWILTYPSTLLNFHTIHQIGREERKD